ncbi:MAG: hypothetical protein ABIJ61_13420, partial [bacterium]
DLRAFFALFAVGVVLWGGMFVFVVFTRNVLLAAIAGFGLLEWLLAGAALLFEYKQPQSWQAVRPADRSDKEEPKQVSEGDTTVD